MPYMLIALIIGGMLQSIHGNLQLWGFHSSHHRLFKMTGSFFNPGPYSGYLSTVFPVSLGLFLFNITYNSIPIKEYVTKYFHKTHSFYNNKVEKKREGRTKISDYITLKLFYLISLISICFVLSASRSRAAWLAVLVSSLYLVSKKIQLFQLIKFHFNTPAKKLFLLLLLVIIPVMTGVGLYQLKKNSVDGRLLIWNISAKMIKERPFLGYGYDGFKKHYMDYQAEYFKENPGDKRALVAGDSNYAFNELIQLTVENGLFGILPLLAIIFLFFRRIIVQYPQKSGKRFIKTDKLLFQLKQTPVNEIASKQHILYISNATILSIFIFSLFSYPFQILPIKICLAVALSLAAGNMSQLKILNFNKDINLSYTLKSIVSISLFLALMLAITNIQLLKAAYVDWKNAFDRYKYGIYEGCIIDYKKAYPVLKTNGDYLSNYGKALSIAQKHTETLPVLKEASKYYPNTLVYTTLGDVYVKLGLTHLAEEAYIHAWNMNPSRFYPKYLLAKLYENKGNKEKASRIAEELLQKDVKIESIAIRVIRSEMEKLVTGRSK